MKNIALALCFFAAVLAVGGVKTASANKWDIPASACVPDAATIASGKMNTGGFGVSFAGSSTGTIRLICAVQYRSGSTFTSFDVFYSDPDTVYPYTNYQIDATFLKAQHGTSSTTSLGGTSSVNGNTSTNYNFADFTPSDSYWYFFDVSILRSSTANNPEFLGLRIN